jgi:ribosomal protein L34E
MKAEGFATAKRLAIEQGIPVANRVPAGYVKTDDRKLVPDPATAPAILEAFQRRAAGAGPTEIAKFLDARGVPTSQAGQWTKQAVALMLKSRVYRGELRWQGNVNLTSHEPLVSEELWQAAQHPNGRQAQRSRTHSYLLTGVIRCAACGYSLQGTTNGRGVTVYRCTRKHAGGVCPNPVAVRCQDIDKRVMWALRDIVTVLAGDQTEAPDLDQLQADVERAARRVAQLADPDAQDALGGAYLSVFRQRREEHEAAVRALDDARDWEARANMLQPDVIDLHGSHYLDAVAVPERRALLARYLDAVAVRKGSGPDGRRYVELDVYARGTLDMDVTMAGFKRNPGLHPFPDVLPAAPGTRLVL